MSKRIFILLLASVMKISGQQGGGVLIDGHVYDPDGKSPIVNADIHLKLGKDMDLIASSDTNGYYSFRFGQIGSRHLELSVWTSKRTRRSGAKCPCYLSPGDIGRIDLPDSLRIHHYVKDFTLTLISDCCQPYIPKLHFKYQSLAYDTIFSSSYFDKNDSLLDLPENGIRVLAGLLKDNPKIIVRLDAHCSSDEKLKPELSQLRAEKVKVELIRLGIDEKRIVAKGLGDTRELIRADRIRKAKTKQEKERLLAQNRRCTFSILSWDYGVDETKKDTKDED